MEVCLYAAHPLMLERMRLQLRPEEFQVHAFLLPDACQAEQVPLLAAAVYAVDAHEPDLLQRLLLRLAAFPRMIAVADDFERHRAFALLRDGVRGLVRYERLGPEFARALRAVAAGAYWAPRLLMAEFVDELLAHQPGPGDGLAVAGLRPRERQVLDGIVAQRSNKEIASDVGISERTVKFHVSNLLHRFTVQTRHELTLRVLRQR
ncbi:MAG: response regulator transcription factor [Terriglobales bacterium]